MNNKSFSVLFESLFRFTVRKFDAKLKSLSLGAELAGVPQFLRK